jgi:hypothetical protein
VPVARCEVPAILFTARRDIAAVPAATRARAVVARSRHDVRAAAGRLSPRARPRVFAGRARDGAGAAQQRSHGWMFGDVDSIVLTMMPEQIATSRFAEAELHRGF